MRSVTKCFFPFLWSLVISLIFSAPILPAVLLSSAVGVDAPIYFNTPSGEPVIVASGIYVVEPAEDWLRMIPLGGERVDAIVIDAEMTSHDQDLQVPEAYFMPGAGTNAALKHLVLWLPGGAAYVAVGSDNGVFPRSMFGDLFKAVGDEVVGDRGQSGEPCRVTTRGLGPIMKKIGDSVNAIQKSGKKIAPGPCSLSGETYQNVKKGGTQQYGGGYNRKGMFEAIKKAGRIMEDSRIKK